MITPFLLNCQPRGPGAGIMKADDRQVTTIFTVQPSFHHRHSKNRVTWSITIVDERAVKPHLVVRRRWLRSMIFGLWSADGGMTVGLWRRSSLDGRRPPLFWPLERQQSKKPALTCLGWQNVSERSIRYPAMADRTCEKPDSLHIYLKSSYQILI